MAGAEAGRRGRLLVTVHKRSYESVALRSLQPIDPLHEFGFRRHAWPQLTHGKIRKTCLIRG